MRTQTSIKGSPIKGSPRRPLHNRGSPRRPLPHRGSPRRPPPLQPLQLSPKLQLSPQLQLSLVTKRRLRPRQKLPEMFPSFTLMGCISRLPKCQREQSYNKLWSTRLGRHYKMHLRRYFPSSRKQHKRKQYKWTAAPISLQAMEYIHQRFRGFSKFVIQWTVPFPLTRYRLEILLLAGMRDYRIKPNSCSAFAAGQETRSIAMPYTRAMPTSGVALHYTGFRIATRTAQFSLPRQSLREARQRKLWWLRLLSRHRLLGRHRLLMLHLRTIGVSLRRLSRL